MTPTASEPNALKVHLKQPVPLGVGCLEGSRLVICTLAVAQAGMQLLQVWPSWPGLAAA